MSIKEWMSTLSFKIWEWATANFDILQNIDIYNRKTDTWFSDFNEMAIWPRAWTKLVWDRITWGTWWVYNQVFFVDFYKNIHHFKIYNKKVYELKNNSWTDIWLSFSSNNINTQIFTLPMNLDWSIPTQYTTPSDSSAWEAVKKDDNDSWWAANIWKQLIIVDDTWWKQAYRWTYWLIQDYDSTNKEYILAWAWIKTALKSWAKYEIYDTLWEYIQFTSWADYEKYVFWKDNWDLVNNTSFEWLATKSLRLVKAIKDTEFLVKNISYYWYIWTYNKNTLFYTQWVPDNPFYYNFTTSITIPWNIPWTIKDLYVFKSRLIIGWDRYNAYIQWPIWLNPIKVITKDYWVLPWTLIDLWVDAFYISNTKKIYSLKQNTYWNTLYTSDEWKQVRWYLENFNYNIRGWFDWTKLYYYWEKENWVVWTTIVYDIQYKFWSTYEWLPLSSIVYNNWETYISDNNSDIIRVFDNTIQDDLWTAFDQLIATKTISLNRPFTIKTLWDVYLWLDRYEQSLQIELYWALASQNSKISVKKINISKDEVQINSNLLWDNIIWEWVVGWWKSITDNILLPIIKKIAYKIDDAYFWKIYLKNINWKYFWLNQLDITIKKESNNYFSPKDTI